MMIPRAREHVDMEPRKRSIYLSIKRQNNDKRLRGENILMKKMLFFTPVPPPKIRLSFVLFPFDWNKSISDVGHHAS